MMMIISPLH